MNKNLRNMGIATLVAGALIYPAMKLYQYLINKKTEGKDNEDEQAPKKTMRLLHNTKHTPHHHAVHNGHSKPDVV